MFTNKEDNTVICMIQQGDINFFEIRNDQSPICQGKFNSDAPNEVGSKYKGFDTRL